MTICPVIRLATPADEDAIVSAIQQIHACGESGFFDASGQPFPFSEDKTRSAVRSAVTRNKGWAGVAELDGKIIGAVLLALSTTFYSDSPYLGEQVLFVLPEHRDTSAAEGLLTFAKKLADALNLPLAIAVMSRERVEAKTRLYARVLGQPPSGGVFLIPPSGTAP